jgi:transposase
MQHYVGLDVSVKETNVCIVDKAGKVIREVKVATEPVAIFAVLTEEALAIERIGLEAGPLSQWLYSALAEAGLPVICVETRHMKAALSAQINKSDRNDARGIAQMMRVGLYRPVHVKTLASQKRRMLLTSRQLLQAKALDIENDLRGTLRNFGLKVGMVGTVKFEARIRELVADHPDLAAIVEPLLIARRVLREQLGVLHRQLLEMVRHDEVCRRLMTTPGVGPVVALTFRATVDVPSRFTSSKAVGAAFGLIASPSLVNSSVTMRHLSCWALVPHSSSWLFLARSRPMSRRRSSRRVLRAAKQVLEFLSASFSRDSRSSSSSSKRTSSPDCRSNSRSLRDRYPMLTGSVCIASKTNAKKSTLQAMAPIPAFMAGSIL